MTQPTRRFYLETSEHSLFVETTATDEQMEGCFTAFCLDEQEWLTINGWMIEDAIEEDGKDRDIAGAECRALGGMDA